MPRAKTASYHFVEVPINGSVARLIRLFDEDAFGSDSRFGIQPKVCFAVLNSKDAMLCYVSGTVIRNHDAGRGYLIHQVRRMVRDTAPIAFLMANLASMLEPNQSEPMDPPRFADIVHHAREDDLDTHQKLREMRFYCNGIMHFAKGTFYRFVMDRHSLRSNEPVKVDRLYHVDYREAGVQ